MSIQTQSCWLINVIYVLRKQTNTHLNRNKSLLLLQLLGCHGDEMTSPSGHLCCCLVLRVQTEPWDSTHKHQTSPQCFYFVSEVWWCVQVLLVENRSCLHLFNQYVLLSVNWCELMLTEIQVSSRVQVLISSFSSAAWSIPLLRLFQPDETGSIRDDQKHGSWVQMSQ